MRGIDLPGAAERAARRLAEPGDAATDRVDPAVDEVRALPGGRPAACAGDGRRAGGPTAVRGAGIRAEAACGSAIARPAACAADRAAVFLLPLPAVVRPATGSR